MQSDIPTEDIIPIRALKDNYIWTLLDKTTKKAFVVDPGDANPVIETMEKLQFTLAGILLTHHHADHSGGINELLDYAGSIPVIASHKSPIKTINRHVKNGDEVIFSNFRLQVMEIPGHTLDHIAYYTISRNPNLLFSGDTLFSAGCGRIFEGTPEMMFNSLNKLLQLNDKTKLYCGHEYTLANLRFSHEVEPNNKDIANKIEAATKIGERNGCTLPSTLRDEKTFNPFLRFENTDVIRAAEKYAGKKLNNPVEVFTVIREWKNNWR